VARLLERLDAELPRGAELHVGHGAPGGTSLVAAQRRYIEGFIDAVSAHADAVVAGDHRPVLDAMRALVPTEDLLFLTDLSIEPVLAQLGNGATGSAG
jgi:hypothetical protein